MIVALRIAAGDSTAKAKGVAAETATPPLLKRWS